MRTGRNRGTTFSCDFVFDLETKKLLIQPNQQVLFGAIEHPVESTTTRIRYIFPHSQSRGTPLQFIGLGIELHPEPKPDEMGHVSIGLSSISQRKELW